MQYKPIVTYFNTKPERDPPKIVGPASGKVSPLKDAARLPSKYGGQKNMGSRDVFEVRASPDPGKQRHNRNLTKNIVSDSPLHTSKRANVRRGIGGTRPITGAAGVESLVNKSPLRESEENSPQEWNQIVLNRPVTKAFKMNRQEAGVVEATNWARYDWKGSSPRASRIRTRESNITTTYNEAPIAPYQPPSAQSKNTYSGFAAA